MAISFVGSNANAGTGSSYTIDLTALSGGSGGPILEGDVVVVVAAHGSTTTSAPTASGDVSGSYTVAGSSVRPNGTWDTNFALLYKVMGATPDSTLTIGRQNNSAYGGSARAAVFRGVDTAAPLDATPGTPASGTNGGIPPDGGHANAPSVTPATTGAWVVMGAAATLATTSTNIGPPSGMTDIGSFKGDGSTCDLSTNMAYYSGWTSGAYDPAAITTTEDATSSTWAAQTIALRPLYLYKGVKAWSAFYKGGLSDSALYKGLKALHP